MTVTPATYWELWQLEKFGFILPYIEQPIIPHDGQPSTSEEIYIFNTLNPDNGNQFADFGHTEQSF